MPLKNDWIVAGINNPSFDNRDFYNLSGMRVENTQLLSKEEYKKSDFIRNNDLFKDESGNFSDRIFDAYYDMRAADFGEFQQDDYYKGATLDLYDQRRTNQPDAVVTDVGFDITPIYNPERRGYGIRNVNTWSDPKFSQRELAKRSKVYNYIDGYYEDYSPNDHALVKSPVKWFKDLASEPLVLATWDSDGEHLDSLSGTMVKHSKGEAKLNDEGTYYYETLGGRSMVGKDPLVVSDTLTVDGEGINKYDFFDSNDIKKSVAGSVARTVVSLIPLFVGGPVAGVYAGLRIATGMAQSVPMVYSFISSFVDNNTEAPSWVNNISSYSSRLRYSTSDYAQQHMMAFENIIKMVGDVANQYGEQKLVASGFNFLKGANRYIEEAEKNMNRMFELKKGSFKGSEEALRRVCYNMYMPRAQELASNAGKLGRDLSLVYMSLSSNPDVYDDMIDRGLTKREAAAVSFGSTFGMFVVDKWLHLGELFYEEATPEVTKQVRDALKKEFRLAHGALNNVSKSKLSETNKILTFMGLGAKGARKAMKSVWEDLKYHSTSMLGKMVGEGVEEVGEEVAADLSKQLYEILGALGVNTTLKDAGSWENAENRYLMNFLGGFIGGGVFYGREVFQGRTFHKPDDDLVMETLIRNGNAKELRDMLEVMHNDGQTGSMTLSGRDFVQDKKSSKKTWITAKDSKTSQGQIVHDLVSDRINILDEIITNGGYALTDDELFNNMVRSEERYAMYKNLGALTNYYEKYAETLNNYAQSEMALRRARTTETGLDGGAVKVTDAKLSEDAEKVREKNLAALEEKRNKYKKELDVFLSGDNSLYYTRKLNFMMDRTLHEPFMHLDKDSYCKSVNGGRSFSSLTNEEKLKFELITWPNHVKEKLKDRAVLDKAFNEFLEFEKVVNPHLSTLEEGSITYKAFVEEISSAFEEGSTDLSKLYSKYIDYDTRLEGETDEQYENRSKRMTDPDTGELETDEAYAKRRRNRNIKIHEYNDKVDEEWAARIDAALASVGYTVDSQTARVLRGIISGRAMSSVTGYETGRGRMRDVVLRNIAIKTDDAELRSILYQLSNKLDNVEAIKKTYADTERKRVENMLEDDRSDVVRILLTDKDGATRTFGEILSNSKLGEEINLQTVSGLIEDLRLTLEQMALIDQGRKSEFKIPDGITFYNYFKEYDRDSILELYNALLEFRDERGWMDDVEKKYNVTTYMYDEYGDNIYDEEGNLEVDEQGGLAVGLFGNEDLFKQSFKEKIDKIVNARSDSVNDTIDVIVERIKANPLYDLQLKLETGIINPMAEMLRKIAESNGDTLPDIEDILNIIQYDYDTLNDVSELIMDDARRAQVIKAANYMRMLQTYLYAASTVPDNDNIIGHNRTINEFARTHAADMREKWNELPELPSDLGMLYISTLERYIKEIDDWIHISDANNLNMINKAVATDEAWSKTLIDVLSRINRTGYKDYDLLEGYESIDQTGLESGDGPIIQQKIERLLFLNVAKIAKKEGKSVEQLFAEKEFIRCVFPDIDEIDNQATTRVNSYTTAETMTKYDRMIYLISVMSQDPNVFYKALKKRVADNESLAPLAVQEYVTRIASSCLDGSFRNIVKKIWSMLPDNVKEAKPLFNTVVISGVAGSGKTVSILSFVNELIGDGDVVIASPKADMSTRIKSALGRELNFSFEKVLRTYLGDKQYEDMMKVFNECDEPKNVNGVAKDVDTKYFTISTGSDGLTKLRIKEGAVKLPDFSKMKTPKAFLLDEATHLSTFEAELFNLIAEKMGAVVFMCGDMAQAGHFSENNLVSNINEGSIFAVRTPEMTVSYRSNNSQKFNNNNTVRSILETVIEKRLYATTKEYEEYFAQLINLMRNINPRIYRKDELNGDMAVSSLDNETIAMIAKAQSEGKSVAFVGSEGSATLAALRAGGVEIRSKSGEDEGSVYDAKGVQGREFDLVIVDEKFMEPLDTSDCYTFLQKLYTLMTRSRDATIFVSDVLPSIIGNNVISEYQSKAPTINSAVEMLRQRKKELLDRMDLESEPDAKTEKAKKGSAGKDDSASVPETSEFVTDDPDKRADYDKETKKKVKDIATQDSGRSGDNSYVDADVEADYIDTYCDDAIFVGVNSEEGVERKSKTGRIFKAPLWTTAKGDRGTLRNLSAVYGEGKELFWFDEKQKAQKDLAKMRSAILFGHNMDEMPDFLRNRFPQQARNGSVLSAGRIEFELRAPNDMDVPRLGSQFDRKGIDWKGTNVMANLVFVFTDVNGNECRIDLCAVNDPDTLHDNIPDLKDKWKTRLRKKGVSEDEKKMLQNRIDTIDITATKYTDWFDGLVEIFKKNGGESVTLDVTDKVTTSRRTWLKKRNKKIRLGSRINPNRLVDGHLIENDVTNLMDLNPDKVFSRVYTFTGSEEDFDFVDPSLKGKAVVFVTSDALADPDRLITEYFDQRVSALNNADTGARVRMVVLGNVGLSFRQLTDEAYNKAFTKTGGNDSKAKWKPVSQRFTGVRMFVSLWNARAAILQFQDAIKKFKSDNGYSDEDLENIARASYERYLLISKKVPEEEVRKNGNVLSKLNGRTYEDIQKLDEFNNTTLREVPMWRYGYSSNGNGFHIHQFSVDGSERYTGMKEANFCVIDLAKANKFYQLLDNVLCLISPSEEQSKSGLSGIGSTFKIVEETRDKNGNAISKERILSSREYIDVDDANHKNTLSGLLKNDNGGSSPKIKIVSGSGADARTVAVLEGQQWTVVPKMLADLAATTYYYQDHTEDMQKSGNVFSEVYFDDKENMMQKFDVNLFKFVNSRGGLIKPVNNMKDDDLFNLFGLVFHGTSEDVHSKPIQMQDAYFKEGFFVDHDAVYDGNWIKVEDVGVFAKLDSNLGLYNCDSDIMAGGLHFNFNEVDMSTLRIGGKPINPNTGGGGGASQSAAGGSTQTQSQQNQPSPAVQNQAPEENPAPQRSGRKRIGGNQETQGQSTQQTQNKIDEQIKAENKKDNDAIVSLKSEVSNLKSEGVDSELVDKFLTLLDELKDLVNDKDYKHGVTENEKFEEYKKKVRGAFLNVDFNDIFINLDFLSEDYTRIFADCK